MTSVMNTTLSFIADHIKSHVLDEKIFVVPSYQTGHQIGERLAANGHSWINLRFVTLPALAHDVTGLELSKRKLNLLSETASLFLAEHIFRVLKEEGRLEYFKDLGISTGLMRAWQRSVSALRMAGLKSKDLSAGMFSSEDKGREIIQFLKRYEDELITRHWLDQAGTFSLALEVLDEEKPAEEKDYLCLECHVLTGLERAFLEKSAQDRLIVVPQGPVFGLERPRRLNKGQSAHSAPSGKSRPSPLSDSGRLAWVFAPEKAPKPVRDDSVSMFRALGPTNECREILRRVFYEKVPSDRVEVIHPPGSTYPLAFSVLSAKAGLKVTYADGLPLNFTKPGAAFRGFVDWIENGYQAADLCRMIEEGTLRLSQKKSGDSPSAQKIGRYLKAAMIGWGKERYLPRLRSLRQGIERRGEWDEDSGEKMSGEQIAASVREVIWIESLIAQILSFAPAEDERGFLDLGLWCNGVSGFLRKFSRVRNELDREALTVLLARITEIARMAGSRVSREQAFEWLRSLAESISVGASGPLPGHMHLASYGNGGYSGRRLTFVAGLDQGSFPGIARQDPILLDEEREALSGALPTTSDDLKEKLYAMASLLASLRGKAVFSYSSYDIIEERPSFPSSLLLQVHRLIEGIPELDYSALVSALPEASGFTPGTLDKAFDEIDWWLFRLGSGGRLLDGRESIRRNFAQLGRGIEAVESRAMKHLTWFDGLVAVDEKEFNPLLNRDIVMSSSRFEQLAKCPFGYFLKYILGIKKPDELHYDQSRWLDALQRGALLHKIFFSFMREIRERKETVSLERHLPLMEKTAEDAIARIKEEVPPPSAGIFEREKRELMGALRVFLKAEESRDRPAQPVLLEASFGMWEKEGEGMEEAAVIPVDRSRSVKFRGKIDRIDRIRGNTFRVLDYKTGGYDRYESMECFGRGKIIQHVLYSAAAEQILKKLGLETSPEIVESGYYFPTKRGEGKEILVKKGDGARLRDLLRELSGICAAGNFIVNPDAHCEYCDYRPVCTDEAPAKAKAKQEANPSGFSLFERLKDYE